MSPLEAARSIAATGRKRDSFDVLIHALVVLCVVACATALRLHGDISESTVSLVYGSAIGYAAGRSGTTGAAVPTVITGIDQTTD